MSKIIVLKKENWFCKKKSLEEKISSLLQKQNDWLEPMQEWIKDAQNLNGIAQSHGIATFLTKRLLPKKSLARTCSSPKKQCASPKATLRIRLGKWGGNQWDALRASHLLALKKPLRSVLVGYNWKCANLFWEKRLRRFAKSQTARAGREGKGLKEKGIPAPPSLPEKILRRSLKISNHLMS